MNSLAGKYRRQKPVQFGNDQATFVDARVAVMLESAIEQKIARQARRLVAHWFGKVIMHTGAGVENRHICVVERPGARLDGE